MSLLPETQPAARRSRTLWIVALAAMLVLALVAVLAVVTFVRLGLLSPPAPDDPAAGANAPAVVAPAPTVIQPELFSPPSEWDDGVG
jgi:hypothetical protein